MEELLSLARQEQGRGKGRGQNFYWGVHRKVKAEQNGSECYRVGSSCLVPTPGMLRRGGEDHWLGV